MSTDVDPSAGFAELSVGKYFAAHQRFLPSTTSSPSTPQTPSPRQQQHFSSLFPHHPSQHLWSLGHNASFDCSWGRWNLLALSARSSLADPHLPYPSPHLPV